MDRTENLFEAVLPFYYDSYGFMQLSGDPMGYMNFTLDLQALGDMLHGVGSDNDQLLLLPCGDIPQARPDLRPALRDRLPPLLVQPVLCFVCVCAAYRCEMSVCSFCLILLCFA